MDAIFTTMFTVINLVQASYFAAAALFILGLKRMSSPATARSGIIWAGWGMVVATVATFLIAPNNMWLMLGGFTGDQVEKVEKIMLALSKVFLEKDASLAEINPLAITKKGDVVVLDAKIDFDDNALFRHKDIEALRDLGEENPVEVRAATANLNFIQLDGNIGCLVNGAGLAMGTMDIIKYHGGEPVRKQK